MVEASLVRDYFEKDVFPMVEQIRQLCKDMADLMTTILEAVQLKKAQALQCAAQTQPFTCW